MNFSLSGQNKQQADGGKRSINLSEEELSDRRSTSSTDSTEQRNEEEKCQRSTRKAAKEIWLGSYNCIDLDTSSDEEWNTKSSAGDSNDDTSDPPWTPVPVQSNCSPLPKLTRIVNKTKASNLQFCKQSIPKKEEVSAEKALIPPPKLKATKKKKFKQEISIPPILTAETPAVIKDQEDEQILTKPPKLTKITKKKRGSIQKLSQPSILTTIVKNEKSLTQGSILKTKKVTKNETPEPICSKSIVSSKDQVTKSQEPPKLTSPVGEKQVKQEPGPSPILSAEEVEQLQNPRHCQKIARNGKTIKRNSQELYSPSDVVTDVSQDLSHPKVTAKKKKKTNTKPPTLKTTTNDEVDVQETSEKLSIIVMEEETDYLELPTLQPISDFTEDDFSKYRSSLQQKSGDDATENSPHPSHPPVLDSVPISENFKQKNEDQTSQSPPNQQKTVKKKKTNPKPSPSKMNPQEKKIHQEETKVSDFESTSTRIECSLSFAGIISHNASLLERGFDSGKFIMLKSDFKTQKSPCIWRIDGKNLLQKYEPIPYNDGMAYRNISTYSSWMASNKGLYVPIDVEFSVQSKSETIVTFDRSNVMLPVEDEMMEVLNKEATGMIDTFQIYLQTLISQALDSNFVKEIVREQDEYFLTSIAAVEDHWILPKRQMLKEVVKMKKHFQELLEVHPGLNLQCVTSGDKSCESCGGRNPTRSFEFQPITYSFDTLDIKEGKPSTKTYRLCLSCTDRVLLYHELFHLRYHLFTCCKAKVKQYDQCDGPTALTLSLADQSWKILMHRKVLLVLAETQQTVSQHSLDG